MKHLKRNLPNTPMLGAVIRTCGAVTKENLVSTLRHILGETMKKEVVEGNVKALEEAFAGVQGV